MDFKRIDEKIYEKDKFSQPSDEVFRYDKRNKEESYGRHSHNSLFLKRAFWSEDVHIREMLGYLLAKACGIDACETELAIYPTIRDRYENAVISYEECSSDETTILPINIVKTYRKKVGIIQENDWILDTESILNTVFERIRNNGRPMSDYDKFLQDFIDMMIFDIRFVNSDRDHKNWLLRENKKTGEISMYPLYDNASVLASENLEDSEHLTQEQAEELSRTHPLSILLFQDFMAGKRETNYQDMFKYLMRKYPEQTKKSLEKVSRVDENLLGELIDSIPGFDENKKDQLVKVFKARGRQMEELIAELNKEQSIIK